MLTRRFFEVFLFQDVPAVFVRKKSNGQTSVWSFPGEMGFRLSGNRAWFVRVKAVVNE